MTTDRERKRRSIILYNALITESDKIIKRLTNNIVKGNCTGISPEALFELNERRLSLKDNKESLELKVTKMNQELLLIEANRILKNE